MVEFVYHGKERAGPAIGCAARTSSWGDAGALEVVLTVVKVVGHAYFGWDYRLYVYSTRREFCFEMRLDVHERW